MKVAITINDVMRDFYQSFVDNYQIYEEETKEPEIFAESFEEDEETGEPISIFEKDSENEKEKVLLHLYGWLDPMYLTHNFKFEDYEDYYNFLYSKMSFEIFGKATVTYKNVMADLHELMRLLESKNIEVDLISLENNNSKPATLFFLSREKAKFNSLKFVNNYQKLWTDYQIIITADNYLIETKPKRRKLLKIETLQNNKLETQNTFKTLSEVIKYFQQ